MSFNLFEDVYRRRNLVFAKAYILTNPMDETTAQVLDTALATF